MKILSGFIVSFVFSCSAWATTLGEIGAAAGIASELQKSATVQHKETLQNVKETVENYEEVQKRNLSSVSAPPPIEVDPELEERKSRPEEEPEGPSVDLKQVSKEELDERLRDEEIFQRTRPVDYKASMQVFYKRKCAVNQPNCSKSPVLTNIKSVIFDYAHTRGSFAKSEKISN